MAPLDPTLREALDVYLQTASFTPNEPPSALVDYLAVADDSSFHRELFRLIRADGRPEPTLYEAAGLDRRRFSRIRSDYQGHPDKLTVLSLAFVLRLTLAQTEYLLHTAGLALSPTATFDLIIRYFLEHPTPNPYLVNDALLYYHQPLLFGVRS